jgi:hypothetical protein
MAITYREALFGSDDVASAARSAWPYCWQLFVLVPAFGSVAIAVLARQFSESGAQPPPASAVDAAVCEPGGNMSFARAQASFVESPEQQQ